MAALCIQRQAQRFTLSAANEVQTQPSAVPSAGKGTMDPDFKPGFDHSTEKESSPTPEHANILPKLLSLCCICGNDVGPGSNREQAAPQPGFVLRGAVQQSACRGVEEMGVGGQTERGETDCWRRDGQTDREGTGWRRRQNGGKQGAAHRNSKEAGGGERGD